MKEEEGGKAQLALTSRIFRYRFTTP